VLLERGWRQIDAVDISRLAWDAFAAREGQLPEGVRFYQASDERFLELRGRAGAGSSEPSARPYDLVIVNYAVNAEKARRLAAALLEPGPGRLLAPTNVNNDYWFEQKYVLLDHAGNVQWSRATLGSYDVLFQPDFTSPTCQGQWCPALRADVSGLAL
jgi:hypothetical protein